MGWRAPTGRGARRRFGFREGVPPRERGRSARRAMVPSPRVAGGGSRSPVTRPRTRSARWQGSLRLGRARIPVEEGDTIASAMYRSGVRTFSRSLKYHRRRGLYCGTGECPNCSLTVDGVPGIRACVTPAADGMRVRRERGWPSTERDVLAILDRLHALLPVGFYYKTFIRPRWLWSVADRIIRRSVGLGRLPEGPVVSHGPGISSATCSSSGQGRRAGRPPRRRQPGTSTWCSATRARCRIPRKGSRSSPRHSAIGVYEGPMVALASPDGLVAGASPADRGGDGRHRGARGLPRQRPARGDARAGGRGPRGKRHHARPAGGRRRGSRGGSRASGGASGRGGAHRRGCRPAVPRGTGPRRRPNAGGGGGAPSGREGPRPVRRPPRCRRRDPWDRMRPLRPVGRAGAAGRPLPDGRRGRGRVGGRRVGRGGPLRRRRRREPCVCARTCPWGIWLGRGPRATDPRSS